ncbi:MAG: hypothetical protein PHN55_04935 [Dysgonamonadaceae bacterium]|nr:hypothetical protein [Dysgonamonadaceae bacterium]
MKTQIFKIKRVPYTQMLKSEMADYVEKTIAIVDKHEPELALFNPLFEELSGKDSDIHLLRLDHGIDLERLRSYKLKEELNLTISAFKLKVRIISKSTPKLEIHILENAINNHLRYLNKCKNNHVYNQRVSGFFDLYQNDLEMQEAISTFKLSTEYDNMCVAYSELKQAWQTRVELLSERPNFETKVIVKEMTKTLTNLFNGIEVASMVAPLSEDGTVPEDQVDFAPLINELNQLTGMVRTSISIRNANNKRKAKGEDDGDGGLNDDPQEPIDGETPIEPDPDPETEPEGGDPSEGDGATGNGGGDA